ncbi:MAG: 3* terminal RNA ribose 2*-O-methyltransferase Hen1 [Chloroflexi bacterium AL-W]|nr:3* terminal RNA ribose 2*-O-methyltransferase Hen1 [Chloroflexi bacterium AL-N1]NOK67649.1 3* terminal RNA ribose 2*-O-methyltransferase Hen1 [Chloroflexi bacterium AL-N10]NOK75581.1 3* terminal RNA ribose 2*-O-methyltransferase Hen1 [Chloroflexi bacterium AL-N5]NOK82369.1 3* terminal RNA ribose 2*-O-methyltransferase Hen1 [Chloroflexi bacterium AL-W]NOK90214.1 3* terminal RNA ribose 2*-O-methyltransferase Hen1 [Chloroflexi bacterium AL-N15]
MLLTITTTYRPATDLGYLLHKHPDRLHKFPLSFGQAQVFYPEATEERCTAVLLLDIDAVRLVRRGRGGGLGLSQYVNDRPYVASSFLSVAIAQVYGSALHGRTKTHDELAHTPLPLEARVVAVPCREGEALLRRLFEPLGYAVTAERSILDPTFSDWGMSDYYTITLSITTTLQTLLSHLYVLIPVLDDAKHYYVDEHEIEKLLRHGTDWLPDHPEVELITHRYLRRQRNLTRNALARLADSEVIPTAEQSIQQDTEETIIEQQVGLHQQRLAAVVATLKQCGARTVIDLGCGEGKLLALLLEETQFSRIAGMDVSFRMLEIAQKSLKLDRLAAKQPERIMLFQGSLVYRDPRLHGYDAAAIVEVIEHLDPPRLAAFERVVFEFARPSGVIITTPNAEYNTKWETLPAGTMRHPDHRFEWSRTEFQAWAQRVGARFGYQVNLHAIGDEDEQVGSPSQMAVFELKGRNA